MNNNDLESRARAGDPRAAFELGKQCIDHGYGDTGRKWLLFAIDRGSVEASLELGQILNLAGDTNGARKALSLASMQMHPMAFFIAAMTYRTEQDYQMAETLFRLASSNGVAHAQALAEEMAVLRGNQQAANNKELKVDENLAKTHAKEGEHLVRRNWWIGWFPKDRTIESLENCATSISKDFEWQINQKIRVSARKENLRHWNHLIEMYESEESAATAILSDPIDFQKAVGFVDANEIMEYKFGYQNLEKLFSQLPEDQFIDQFPYYVREMSRIYLKLNRAALSRLITLIAYLMWKDAFGYSDKFAREAELSFKYESGTSSSSENLELSILRKEIENSGVVNLGNLEVNPSVAEAFSIAFPTSNHTHLVGQLPMAGWEYKRSGVKQHLCTKNFRNGGWHCEHKQLNLEQESEVSTPKKSIQVAKKAIAKKLPRDPSKKTTTKKPVPKKITGVKKTLPSIKHPESTKKSDANIQVASSSLNSLIDRTVANDHLNIPLAEPGWSRRPIIIGPIMGVFETQDWTLRFEFQIGKFSGRTGSTNLAERLAKVCPLGCYLSATLQPHPEIVLHITIPCSPTDDYRLVVQTFTQVANLVITVLKEAIKTNELLEPNTQELASYGLLQPSLALSRSSWRNWKDPHVGGKILYGRA